MGNENPSRDSASRQQSAERAQSGSIPSSQQGAGSARALTWRRGRALAWPGPRRGLALAWLRPAAGGGPRP